MLVSYLVLKKLAIFQSGSTTYGPIGNIWAIFLNTRCCTSLIAVTHYGWHAVASHCNNANTGLLTFSYVLFATSASFLMENLSCLFRNCLPFHCYVLRTLFKNSYFYWKDKSTERRHRKTLHPQVFPIKIAELIQTQEPRSPCGFSTWVQGHREPTPRASCPPQALNASQADGLMPSDTNLVPGTTQPTWIRAYGGIADLG